MSSWCVFPISCLILIFHTIHRVSIRKLCVLCNWGKKADLKNNSLPSQESWGLASAGLSEQTTGLSTVHLDGNGHFDCVCYTFYSHATLLMPSKFLLNTQSAVCFGKPENVWINVVWQRALRLHVWCSHVADGRKTTQPSAKEAQWNSNDAAPPWGSLWGSDEGGPIPFLTWVS